MFLTFFAIVITVLFIPYSIIADRAATVADRARGHREDPGKHTSAATDGLHPNDEKPAERSSGCVSYAYTPHINLFAMTILFCIYTKYTTYLT